MKKIIASVIVLIVILTSFNIKAFAAENQNTHVSETEVAVDVQLEEVVPKTEQELFFEEMLPIALYIQGKFYVPVSVTMGVSAQETEYGKHLCGGSNYFGYKGSYNGQSCYTDTTEYYDGVNAETVPNEQFRAYSSMKESALDFADLMCKPRYDGVRLATNYKDAIRALKKAGYATSPIYESNVTWIIETYGLNKYDVYTLPTFESTRGDRGRRVVVVQEMLLQLGYDLKHYGADGAYGPVTEAAVTQFQQEHGLETSGQADMNTMKVMAYWCNTLEQEAQESQATTVPPYIYGSSY